MIAIKLFRKYEIMVQQVTFIMLNIFFSIEGITEKAGLCQHLQLVNDS
jgi:hypothetical protein